ncbi:MAG: Ca2+-binding RTX toxin-like protein, partial [Planctomycetaceae bacterium]
NGTATGSAGGTGADFDNAQDQVTFAANSTTPKTVTVAITNDMSVELSETFTASLALDAGTPLTGRTSTLGTGTGTITDNDTATFTINDVTVDEADGTATFTVSLSNPLDIAVDVDVSFADVTTDAGDFTHTTQTVSFAAGSTTAQPVNVAITNDMVGEPTETFTAALTLVTGVAMRSVSVSDIGTGTITDNDATFTISDATVNESAGTATFTVSLDRPIDIDVDIDVTYAGGTATGGGTDYDSATDTLTFTAGSTASQNVTVSIVNDNTVELDETFIASLSTATVLGGRSVDLTDTGTGTITDNDTATFTINDVQVNEAAGTATFTVSLDNPIDIATTVNVNYADGTATGAPLGTGADFDNDQDQAVFAANTTTAQAVTVTITDDAIVELTETFAASLAVPTALGTRTVVVSDTGIGTITDNDINTAIPLFIDDGDPGFSTVNGSAFSWFNYGPSQGGYQDDQRYSFYDAGDLATWTVAATGSFRVSATWNPHPFASQEAEFRILDGATLVATVFADQKHDPADPTVGAVSFSDSGVNWAELVESHTFTTNVTVQLVGDAGKLVIADAIRISTPGNLEAERTGPALPTEPDLMQENLPATFAVAIDTWVASGQISEAQKLELQRIVPIITDLPGNQVGRLDGSVMLLDIDAAGNGWFVDPTPNDNSEFNTLTSLTERVAGGNSHAVGDIDLLTVVLHEFGHVLDQVDLDPATNPGNLMAGVLPTGVRRLPESVNATTSVAPADLVVDLPATDGHVDISLFDGYLVVQSNQTILERIDVSAAQTLTINGTDGVDNFRIDLDQSGDLNLTAIFVHGYGDDDEIVLDGVPQLLTGSVAIDGGTGNDRVEIRGVQRTALTLSGSDGNDTLYGGMGDESIDGGAGADMLFGGSGNDRVNGGTGNDLIHGNTGDDTLVGNDGDDNIHGGSGHDVLTGGAGNDNLSGQGGNDTLIGHDGDDVLNGGAGRDALSGGAGQDQLRGGSQNDLLVGGLGNDELQGNSGHDTLAGEDGDDSLNGGHGDDAVDGGAGNNFVFGREAVDSLFGASALREELLLNPQAVVPELASGSDTFIAIADDSPVTPDDDTEELPASQPGSTVDIDFNLFAEWIDLV